jgi:hypothetical protein
MFIPNRKYLERKTIEIEQNKKGSGERVAEKEEGTQQSQQGIQTHVA